MHLSAITSQGESDGDTVYTLGCAVSMTATDDDDLVNAARDCR